MILGAEATARGLSASRRSGDRRWRIATARFSARVVLSFWADGCTVLEVARRATAESASSAWRWHHRFADERACKELLAIKTRPPGKPTATGRRPVVARCCSISEPRLGDRARLASGRRARLESGARISGTRRPALLGGPPPASRQRIGTSFNKLPNDPATPQATPTGHLDGRDQAHAEKACRLLPGGLWRQSTTRRSTCLAKDRDVLLAFYDFPAEHWKP